MGAWRVSGRSLPTPTSTQQTINTCFSTRCSCAILEYMVFLQFCLPLIWHGLYLLAPTASHLKYYTALYAFSYWKKLKFLCGFSNLAHMRHAWRKIFFSLLSVSIQNRFSYPIVYSLIFTYSFTFSQFLLCLVCFAICYFEFSLIFQIHMTYSTIKLTFTVMPFIIFCWDIYLSHINLYDSI